ncbi:hypothetical protein [Clostridium sp. C8-1-8]|nr:hypothetical protein [Clostridium sp. C8-1-8]
MIIIGLLSVVALIGFAQDTSKSKIMSDFCKIECKQNIGNKYEFCC